MYYVPVPVPRPMRSRLCEWKVCRLRRLMMNHSDHVRLLRKGVPEPGGVWADLGSGSGAFTLALADLLGASGHIYSVDKDRRVLREQEQAMRSLFPSIMVEF